LKPDGYADGVLAAKEICPHSVAEDAYRLTGADLSLGEPASSINGPVPHLKIYIGNGSNCCGPVLITVDDLYALNRYRPLHRKAR